MNQLVRVRTDELYTMFYSHVSCGFERVPRWNNEIDDSYGDHVIAQYCPGCGIILDWRDSDDLS